MRGKAHLCSAVVSVFGITPAYAGKRHFRREIPRSKEDHPRLCGEKAGDATFIASTLGSPPPMRGKGGAGEILMIGGGITPAYAGKSIEAAETVFKG